MKETHIHNLTDASEPILFNTFESLAHAQDYHKAREYLINNFDQFESDLNLMVSQFEPSAIDRYLTHFMFIKNVASTYFYDGANEEVEDETGGTVKTDKAFYTGRKLALLMAQVADEINNYYLSAIAEDIVLTIDFLHYKYSKHGDNERKDAESVHGVGKSELITDNRLPYHQQSFQIAPGIIGVYEAGGLEHIVYEREMGTIRNIQDDKYIWLQDYNNKDETTHERWADSPYEVRRKTPYLQKIDNTTQSRLDPAAPNEDITLRDTRELLQLLHRPLRTADSETLLQFLQFASLPIRFRVEEDFGVNLGNVDIPVQYHLLQFLKTSTRHYALEVAKNGGLFGSEFIQSFLSLETDNNLGKSIMRIASSLEHDTAQKVFAKYAELVRASEQTRDYIRENYGEQLDANSVLENELIEQLLGRGKDILVYAASAPDQIDVVQYLEGAKTEIIMFANTFRTLKAHGDRVDLEQFKKVHIERIVGSDLSDELKQQLSAISAANWANHGVLGEKIQNEFEQLLSDQHKLEDTEFYQVLHENDILAFFRLDHYKTGLYFGSVNAQADLKGSKIGESLLEQIFKVATHDQTVRAHCSPKAPITSKYIGQFGFIATKIVDYAENADTFEIMRPKRGFSLELQGFSYDQLAARASTDQNDRMPLVRHYQFPDQYAQFVAEAQQYLGSVDPYAITAYAQRRAEHNKTDVMVGFERLPTHFGQENPEF